MALLEGISEKVISEQSNEARLSHINSFGERQWPKMGTILIYWKNSKVTTVYWLVS